MCKCITEITNKVEKGYMETKLEDEQYTGSSLVNTAIIFREDNRATLETTSMATVNFTKATKSGQPRNRQLTYHIAHKYCPFCGEPYSK